MQLKKTSFNEVKTVTSTTGFELILSGDVHYEGQVQIAVAVVNKAAVGGPSVEFATAIQIVPDGEWIFVDDYVMADGRASFTPLPIQPTKAFYGQLAKAPVEKFGVYAKLSSAGSAQVAVNARIVIDSE